MTKERINFSAELRPGIMNYADNAQVCSEVCKTSDRINEIYKEVEGPQLHSILEDMLEETSQLCYHLTLK